ncbi:MAG: CinA family protein [Neisseriaceae bacterium]|nr:CinA family protein [Neisseriaceae bacterium]
MKHSVLQPLTQALLQQQYTVTCAESCTGGLLAAALTEYAGSSAWFNMGFTTYSNQAKQQLLGVRQATLDHHGAVSAETVQEMAAGALAAAAADFALSISGIAGPGGGSEAKPVGTVWFGLAQRSLDPSQPAIHSEARMHLFTGNREQVRAQAVVAALHWLLEVISPNHSK